MAFSESDRQKESRCNKATARKNIIKHKIIITQVSTMSQPKKVERCDFCGQLVFTAVVCPWTGGAVHMAHCPECKYFEPIFWHCLYRYKEEMRHEQERNGRQRVLQQNSHW